MNKTLLTLLIGFSNFSIASDMESLSGKWCSFFEPNGECGSIEILYKDGTYYSHGIIQESKLRYESRGQWKYENGKSCFISIENNFFHSETGKVIEMDIEHEPYCDRILDIKPNEVTIEQHTNKTIIVLKRIQD